MGRKYNLLARNTGMPLLAPPSFLIFVIKFFKGNNMNFMKRISPIFMLFLLIPISNAQAPHTLYGYVFYADGRPAKNFSIMVINCDRDETITNESQYIYRNQNYYQIEVGCPGPCWENGEKILVVINGSEEYSNWKGNATLIIDLSYPNQQVPDIFLYPPPPSTPQKPSGSTKGFVGFAYNFSTVASDPNNFNISYGWDWNGDGIVDEWSDWLPSDTICTMQHKWEEKGSYEIKVIAKNEYGAVSNWSEALLIKISKDETPPNTIILEGPEGVIRYNTVFFRWKGEDDVTKPDKLQYSYILEGYMSKWSEWSYNTSVTFSSLPNGEYTFKVRAKDEEGNIDAVPASRTFTIIKDNQPPQIIFIKKPSEEIKTRTAYFEWSAEDNYSPPNKIEYSYSLITFSNWTVWNKNTSAIFSGLENGKYTFKVRAKDEAGNIGEVEYTFIVNASLNDTSIPIVKIVSPKENEKVAGVIKINFSINDNDKNLTITIKYFDGKEWHEIAKEKNITFYELNTKKLPNGECTIAVYAEDSAGNVGYDIVKVNVSNKKSPGFEIILLITSILLILRKWKSKK